MSHGRPTIPLMTMRSRSDPGTAWNEYSAADGQSRLNRSLPVCFASAWVYARCAPHFDCPVYGRSSVTKMPLYFVSLPFGSEISTLPNPGTSALQQSPVADNHVNPR